MITVILALFNGSKYIIEQLDSLVNQTMYIDCIKIYDDLSSDNSIEIVHNWIKENNIENIEIIKNKENKGYVRNFLDALFEVKGDYIFLCDQDDVWSTNKIETMITFMKEQDKQEPVLLTSGINVVDEKLISKKYLHIDKVITSKILLKNIYHDFSYPGMSFCLNRKLIEVARKHCSVETIPFHDLFLFLVALKYGTVFCINKPLVLYRQHGTNQIGVGGKGKKNRLYWNKVLLQKKRVVNLISFFFFENKYFTKKTVFTNKRITMFSTKKVLNILLNFAKYVSYYDLKSFIADIYYCFVD